ncbi:MAG TPA: type II secretion system F family protein [Gemmatimonadales bacterium]|jgi:tight adherence protein C|nr:type II secretion system F family protein [Gemmatimonadales bacterium]
MLTLIGLFTAGCVVLLTVSLVLLAPRRPAAVGKRLDELRALGGRDEIERRRREANAERLKNVLAVLGGRVDQTRTDTSAVRHFLVQAGYTDASAVQIYWAARIITPALLLIAALTVSKTLHAPPSKALLGILWALGVGWIAPTFIVRSRLKKRQKEVQLAMPDMLDLLVVCVEAGLGLNQALTRVADEIHHVSPVMSEQLTMVNLEMRAGSPRDEALKHLAERTGLPDMKSLVAMLVQTDRFGTSVADALRIQADTLRTKRRQRAEEAAAKTTIKLVFPLVLCIFPAMFVVVLAPSVIAIIRELDKVNM